MYLTNLSHDHRIQRRKEKTLALAATIRQTDESVTQDRMLGREIMTTRYPQQYVVDVPCTCPSPTPVLGTWGPLYTVSCRNSFTPLFLTPTPANQFKLQASTPGVGFLFLEYMDSEEVGVVLGSQIVTFSSAPQVLVPISGTRRIRYTFFCTPNPIRANLGLTGGLDRNYPYVFVNDTAINVNVRLTRVDSSILTSPTILPGNSFTPSPNYGYISYQFQIL
jgi:hypothetical protein